MPQYTEYASVFLNIPQYASTCFSMPQKSILKEYIKNVKDYIRNNVEYIRILGNTQNTMES